jgi:hypothetical protein
MTETQKLAAILAADVIGFGRLAGADQERTSAWLRALRSDLIEPKNPVRITPPRCGLVESVKHDTVGQRVGRQVNRDQHDSTVRAIRRLPMKRITRASVKAFIGDRVTCASK